MQRPAIFTRGSAAAGVAVCAVVASVAGCSGKSPDPDPTVAATQTSAPAPSATTAAVEIPRKLVEQMIPTEMQAMEKFGIEADTLAEMKEAAAALPWRYLTAGGVTHAVACTGSGGPTVVYIDDSGTPAALTWTLVAREQAKTRRVCLYDRPGVGLAQARPEAAQPNGPVANATELRTLLREFGEPGPYVLVGWGYGGLVARTLASQAPQDVAGLALVDAVYPAFWRDYDQTLYEGDQPLDLRAAESQIDKGPRIGATPVVVLEAGKVDEGTSAVSAKKWTAGQKQAATISDNSVYGVVTDSDFFIPRDHPEVVLAATQAILDSVDAQSELAGCPKALAGAGVDC